MKKAVAPLDPAKMAAMLRDGVLVLQPADIGLTPAECPALWGLMIELGYPELNASLVILADGSVSLYMSDGSGVLGCGLHPDVRAAALRLLQLAATHLPHTHVQSGAFPPPAGDEVAFCFFTVDGHRAARVSRAALDEGEVELAELYYAVHGLIGLIELLGAGVDLGDEIQFARSAVLNAAGADAQGATPLHSRGRGCRILPYVGDAARRLRH